MGLFCVFIEFQVNQLEQGKGQMLDFAKKKGKSTLILNNNNNNNNAHFIITIKDVS